MDQHLEQRVDYLLRFTARPYLRQSHHTDQVIDTSLQTLDFEHCEYPHEQSTGAPSSTGSVANAINEISAAPHQRILAIRARPIMHWLLLNSHHRSDYCIAALVVNWQHGRCFGGFEGADPGIAAARHRVDFAAPLIRIKAVRCARRMIASPRSNPRHCQSCGAFCRRIQHGHVALGTIS